MREVTSRRQSRRSARKEMRTGMYVKVDEDEEFCFFASFFSDTGGTLIKFDCVGILRRYHVIEEEERRGEARSRPEKITGICRK